MAEQRIENQEEESNKGGGGGNKNALAYGLLQGAGVNTNGLTPSQAWDLVSQLNLMESKQWKRTDEDKKTIKEKNEQIKKTGKNVETIKQKAKKYANVVNFDGVSNVAALSEAVDSIEKVMSAYQLDKLQFERVKNLSSGVMASANDSGVNIGTRILRNPNAAYRICCDGYKKYVDSSIETTKQHLKGINSLQEKERLQGRLKQLERQAEFSRHNVIYKGKEVESVATHEMGHVLAGQLFGFIKNGLGVVDNNGGGANKQIYDCWVESRKNGDIKSISAYADTSPDEFFAECFAMYQLGEEKLPDKINKMMEGVLKKWKR